MKYYVYVLESAKDGHYYIGHTGNLNIRLSWHNLGLAKSTKGRRPLKLIYSEECESKGGAMKREYYLKSLKGGNEFKKTIIKN